MQTKRLRSGARPDQPAQAVERPNGRWASVAMLGAGLIAGLVLGIAWSGPARSADLRPRMASAPAWPYVPDAPREWRYARPEVRFDHMFMGRPGR